MREGRGPCGVPHTSEAFSVRMDKIVSPLSGWPPNDEDPEVGQSGWPPEDEYLEETWSPRVELADVVTRLQKEFRADSGYGSARRSAMPTHTSDGSGFTSTSVPMYAGTSRWDQYRHVFEAD